MLRVLMAILWFRATSLPLQQVRYSKREALPFWRLLEEILELALLLLHSALALVRTALGLRILVAGYGTRGLLGTALDLVHRPFAPVLATTLSAQVLLLPSSSLVSLGILYTPYTPL